MCSICTCFGWVIDLIQRIITFGLACILSGAVCLGMSIAIIAGIAYGYNYSMAEFLAFSESEGGVGGSVGNGNVPDVTVFMRRGHFYDQPELQFQPLRKSMDGEDLFIAKEDQATVDFESKPFSDTLGRSEDIRKYAELLSKYSSQVQQSDDSEVSLEIRPTLADSTLVHKISADSTNINMAPDRLMVNESEGELADILKSDFKRLKNDSLSEPNATTAVMIFPTKSTDIETRKMYYLNEREQQRPVTILLRDNNGESLRPMRIWNTPRSESIPNDEQEDDDENSLYKPV